MTLSVNSRNIEWLKRQLIQGGVTLGLCNEQGVFVPDTSADGIDSTLSSEAKAYLTALTNVNLSELNLDRDFKTYAPAAKLRAMVVCLKSLSLPLVQEPPANRESYIHNVVSCKQVYEAAKIADNTYWGRFKAEFKRNAKFRLAIYCFIGVAVVALAVLTAGIAVGIAAAVAGSASMSAGIASAFAWGAAVSTASLVFGSLYTAAAGIASGLIAWVFGSKKTSPASAVQQSSSAVPGGNNAHTALAARAPESKPAPSEEQESGCMAFFGGMWKAYEATHSALPRHPVQQPTSSLRPGRTQ